ncbi:MAG: choice-of-anchor D domain-containing protein [Archangiaceae bacterium]|nr:choice-of-anchor D domain-containing protein [Archangiaceae bacterium]
MKPVLQVSPAGLDFGKVKNGDTATRTLKLEAKTATEVQVTKLTLTDASSPGGADAFTVKLDPITLAANESKNLSVGFLPTVLQEYGALLTFTSNDEEHPSIKVQLLGDGSKPIMKVTPDCKSANGCTGTVVVSPPSIDFGAEPFMRANPVDASKLPSVAITNEGEVTLVVTRVAITGTDAPAFKIEGTVTTPLEYDAMAGVNLPIRFKPLSEAQLSYSADLVIESDDPDAASVTVHLVGVLAPNGPPTVCANLIQVTPADGCAPRDYRPTWPMNLTVPAGGYDFRGSRDVEPRAQVVFSAQSSVTDGATCTTDPDTGRTGLTYQWTVVSTPPGSPSLGMSTQPTFMLTPSVPGDYQLSLTVTDPQGHSSAVPIRFAVARKEDLIVRLDWPGASGVDLDLHLVRPSSTVAADPWSGAYSFFDEGANHNTAGDMNGYANRRVMTLPTVNFEWGGVGTCDDPRLNLDDIGDGQLVEDISLNNPERDARCDGGRCAYKIFVHYFRDYRAASATACFADAGPDCSDGEQCSCAAGSKCVATPPADGGRPLGAGECRVAPKPTVKVFLKGSSTPAATIPLPPEEVLVGSPCTMLYAADVSWPSQQETGSLPDGGTPSATVTSRLDAGFAHFGRRGVGDLKQCSPDVSLTQWYSQQP